MKKKFLEDSNLFEEEISSKTDTKHKFVFNNKVFKYTPQEENNPLDIRLRENINCITQNLDFRFLDNNHLIQKLFLIIAVNSKDITYIPQNDFIYDLFTSFSNVIIKQIVHCSQVEKTFNEIVYTINNIYKLSTNKLILYVDSYNGDINIKDQYIMFAFLFKSNIISFAMTNDYILFPLKKGMNNLFFSCITFTTEKISILPCSANVHLTTKGFKINIIDQEITQVIKDIQLDHNEDDCAIYVEDGDVMISAHIKRK